MSWFLAATAVSVALLLVAAKLEPMYVVAVVVIALYGYHRSGKTLDASL